MADATYIKAIEALWQAGIDLLGDTINLVLCTSAYTPDTSSTGDEFLSDIPLIARVATQTLSGKTFIAGVFAAANVVFVAPAAGHLIVQAVLYKDASPESGARLIRLITDAPPLNAGGKLTDGQDITFLFPGDANKIFRTHDG
jgi:hypothetical protein